MPNIAGRHPAQPSQGTSTSCYLGVILVGYEGMNSNCKSVILGRPLNGLQSDHLACSLRPSGPPSSALMPSSSADYLNFEGKRCGICSDIVIDRVDLHYC